MKTETKTRIWAEVKKQLNSGYVVGNSFSLQFDGNGQPFVKIFNNQRWTLPASIIENLTGEAKEVIEIAKQKAIEKSKQTANRLRQDRESLEKRLDEDGFILLAGEETDVVCQGTLRQCRANLWKVHKCPRDPHVGIGCYCIVDKNHIEVEIGKFDKDICW
tara:strand:+ start:46 stop:528 length:483 start_codon:yes stop_codon:yes gene_type:complete